MDTPVVAPAPARPEARGKFLWQGDRKLFLRGITYGTFRPVPDGVDFPSPRRVEEDLAGMAAAGFNAVRTYTPPPRWLLDAAARHGMLVVVGLPWEQHVAFLDDRGRAPSIERRLREAIRPLAGHPAVLCWTIGNEIPASVVRWHGRKRIERFLRRLYDAAKDEDPGGLVTYVNFPTTEYLELPFLDLCAFNVYLEDEERLEAYLARLQVVAGDRPLVMAEIGLDSRRNGEAAQAASLRWQLRTAFRAGCAGAIIFAWTDEWHRGGHDIEDWDFGLVRRDRSPKPALAAVREALAELPLPSAGPWPRISVVVCSYNGARTLDACLRAVDALEYPDYEVILVDDGSTDETPAIGYAHGARVISAPNRGLSSARNTGACAATGEIVAFCDDDAAPDPHWLTYLATTYRTTDHVAVGGPSVVPPDAPDHVACVGNAPGNPTHVLLTDTVAEHIPGCNSSFRRDALLAIGGFDSAFRVAGDDVDVCWRLRERGGTIGFNPAAMVWHHPRSSLRAFWRQQRNYGRAEAMLERKWPQKYNGWGHVSWAGRVYAPGRRVLMERWRVYHGTWGSAFFQRLYGDPIRTHAAAPLMPEWFLLVGLLLALTAVGTVLTALLPGWSPLLLAAGPLAGAAGVLVFEAWTGAGRARFARPAASRRVALRRRALTATLFVAQSFARLHGRLAEGLAPWRRPAGWTLRGARLGTVTVWSETWEAPEQRLAAIEGRIRRAGGHAVRGGDFSTWDLELRGGMGGCARITMAVEEHGSGRQLLRFRLRPRVGGFMRVVLGCFAALMVLGAGAGDLGFVWPGLLGVVALGALVLLECVHALATASRAVGATAAGDEAPRRIPSATLMGPVAAHVAPGEVVAIVGADDGTRRRTLAQLLQLLDAGSAPAGRGDIAVVLERPFVLPLSIRENVMMGRPSAPEEDVVAASRVAGLDAHVAVLPRGYDTVMRADGSPLDAEGLRRLELARAFLRRADILVLGAPFDDGDEVLAELVRGRRTFVVAGDAGEANGHRVLRIEGSALREPS